MSSYQIAAGGRHAHDAGIINGATLDAHDVATKRRLVLDGTDRPFETKIGTGMNGFDELEFEAEPERHVARRKKRSIQSQHQRDDMRAARNERAELALLRDLLVVMQRIVIAAELGEPSNRLGIERRAARELLTDAKTTPVIAALIVHVSKRALAR